MHASTNKRNPLHAGAVRNCYLCTLLALYVVISCSQLEATNLWTRPNQHSFSYPREVGIVGTSYTGSAEKLQDLFSIPADGSLNLKIPLVSLSGKIPVDLTLTYKSGIKLDQLATWVGLGWNLGGWSVRRRTVLGDDVYTHNYISNQESDVNNWQSKNFVNDIYDVSIPGRTVSFINTGTTQTPVFAPLNWSRDSLAVSSTLVDVARQGLQMYIEEPNMDWYWKYFPESFSFYSYDTFIMTDENANRYVFAKALKKQSIGGPEKDVWMFITNHELPEQEWPRNKPENSEWLLTAILSHDYVDGGGNPNDPLDGPSGFDPRTSNKGYWVKLLYTGNGATEGTRWQTMGPPFSGENDFHKSVDSAETAFLWKIVTPTTVATFDLHNLSQYHTMRYYRSESDDMDLLRNKDLVLSQLRVFEYSGVGAEPTGPELFCATFNYEDGISVPLKTWYFRALTNYSAGGQVREGEPALRSVVLGTNVSYNPNILGSRASETRSGGLKARYSFDYDDTLEDPSEFAGPKEWYGDYLSYDKSRYWTYGEADELVFNNAHPTTFQDLTYSASDLDRQEWVDGTAHFTQISWGLRDFFGYHYRCPEGWSLTKLTTPEGLSYEFEYEPNRYKIGVQPWTGGGCRVKSIITNSPYGSRNGTIGRDYEESDTTVIAYGGRNIYGEYTDDFGIPSSMPPTYILFKSTYDPANFNLANDCVRGEPLSWKTGNWFRILGDNVEHAIQYPQITWLLPRGRGRIENSYTVGCYNGFPLCDSLKKIHYGTVHQTIGGDGWTCNRTYEDTVAFYVDYSPMRGLAWLTKHIDGNDVLTYSKEDKWLFSTAHNRTRYTYAVPEYNNTCSPPGAPGGGSPSAPLGGEDPASAMSIEARLIESVEFRDGVVTTSEFSYDGLGRPDQVTLTPADSVEQRVTTTSYASETGCDNYSSIRDRHYLAYPAKVEVSSSRPIFADPQLEQSTEFVYTPQYPVLDFAVFYPGNEKAWVDLNKDHVVDPTEIQQTDTWSWDKYGNPSLMRSPGGPLVGAISSHRGLEGVFQNLQFGSNSQNFALFTAEAELGNQNWSWRLCADCIVTDEAFFTGSRSGKIVHHPDGSASEGPGVTIGDSDQHRYVARGRYVAECWARGAQDKVTLSLSAGLAAASRTLSSADTWQPLACTLQVSVDDQTVQCGIVNTSASADAYVDDIRVYRVADDNSQSEKYGPTLATSYSWDALGRVISISGADNYPTRYYYYQYGGMSNVADYAFSPVKGQEHFFKSTEGSLTDPQFPGRYRRDFPNARYTFESRGRGILEDFSANPFGRLQIVNTDSKLSWSQAKGRIEFTSDISPESCSDHADLTIPVSAFSDGFFAFDFGVDKAGDPLEPQPCSFATEWNYSNLWFGFENNAGSSYVIAFARTGSSFYVLKLIKNGSITDTTVISQAGSAFALWTGEVVYSDPKRLMIGRVGNNIYVFYNNDCIWRCTDNNLTSFDKLKLHFQNPGIVFAIQDKAWVDNLVFYNDPVVVSEFINSFGFTKQTQVWDGQSILTQGFKNTTDGKSQVAFKPIPISESATYGNFGEINLGNHNPFEYIDRYLGTSADYSTDNVYHWLPDSLESPLDLNGSLLHTYLTGTTGVDPCIGGASRFVPYARKVYEQEPRRRLTEDHFEGFFMPFPRRIEYDRSYQFDEGPRSYAETQFIDENSHRTKDWVDFLGRPTRIVADTAAGGINAVTQFCPDFNGNDTLVVDPMGLKRRCFYTNTGWLTWDSAGDYGETRFFYDIAGQLRFKQTATDKDSSRFQYLKYDALGRFIEEGMDTNLGNLSWTKALDPSYPLSSGVDQGHCIITGKYEYDQGQFARGKLTKSIRYHYPGAYPNNASYETFEYDEYGRVTKKSQFVKPIDNAPRVTQAQYNMADQLTKLTYPNGKYITYSYDKSGRLAELRDNDNYLKVVYRYWPDGKVKSKSLGFGTTPAQIVDYTYNARGWLKNINWAVLQNGDQYSLALNYETDADTGMCLGEPPNWTWEFPAGYYNGNVASYTLKVASPGNIDVKQQFAYDGLDRLVHETYTETNAPYTRRYTYNASGCIQTALEEGIALPPMYYQYYENTNRVKSLDGYVQAPNAAVTYTPSGSVTGYTSHGLTIGYNYQEQMNRMERPAATRPSDRNGVDFWYNTEGKRIAKQYTHWYSYTCDPTPEIPIDPEMMQGFVPEGGLDSLDMIGDSTVAGDSLLYGLGGVQMNSTQPPPQEGTCYATNTVKTGYYYFGNDLLADYRGPNSTDLIGNYVYANGERVASFKGAQGDVRYYLTDHLGSVVATVDSSGQLRNSYEYQPWGTLRQSQVTDQEKFNYTGQVRDEELGMNFLYYGARYYDPKLRTFHAVDPAHTKYPALGRYVYCADNPTGKRDRDGREIDVIIDIASVGYDVGDIARTWINGGSTTSTQWYALAADVGCAIVPFLTGGGVMVRSAFKGERAVEALVAVDKVADATRATEKAAGQGFTSFGALKKVLGPAGEGMEWHHVVEQHAENIGKFGAEAIHNTDNVVPIPKAVHQRINAHYSTLVPHGKGITVRQWLSPQSYEAQRAYGQQVLNDFLRQAQ